MEINKIKMLLAGTGIVVSELIDNNKASESYVRTKFIQNDGFEWETVVPYHIRRSGIFYETEEQVASYLISIKKYFTEEWMSQWLVAEEKKWQASKADVTKQFFFKLLSFREETEFPQNDNPARRIQDIKDAGYTVASIPNRKGRTSRILLTSPLFISLLYKIKALSTIKNLNFFYFLSVYIVK